MNIVWGLSGSFCNHAAVLKEIEKTVNRGIHVKPLISTNCARENTRFGTADALKKSLESITGNSIISTITDAEQLGPRCIYDAMVIAPCTSTVLSRLAYGDYDHVCTLGAKAMLRNNRPVILAIASNDILGATANAVFTLLNRKNIYIVPFSQDDPFLKPNSCISHWNLIEKTLIEAVNNGKQLQPVLYNPEAIYE